MTKATKKGLVLGAVGCIKPRRKFWSIINIYFSSVLLLLATGCFPYHNPDGSTVYKYGAQRGVVVQVQNQCTNDPGKAYTSTGDEYLVYPGRLTWIPMRKSAFEDRTSVAITYQVVVNGEIRGSVTRSWNAGSQPTHTIHWTVGGSRSGGGGSNVYHDNVNGLDGRRIC